MVRNKVVKTTYPMFPSHDKCQSRSFKSVQAHWFSMRSNERIIICSRSFPPIHFDTEAYFSANERGRACYPDTRKPLGSSIEVLNGNIMMRTLVACSTNGVTVFVRWRSHTIYDTSGWDFGSNTDAVIYHTTDEYCSLKLVVPPRVGKWREREGTILQRIVP